jgi:hypothetical protein
MGCMEEVVHRDGDNFFNLVFFIWCNKMTAGAVFELITNDGKTDNLLMATSLLNRRLAQIKRMRSNDRRFVDPNPTLVDIERTHILFMNAHFKPFAALAYEYQLQRAKSGNTSLGGNTSFSIAQFGDFIHDMVLHVKLSEVSAANTNDSNRFIKYCDFPGLKLLKETRFTVNGNPLDKYTNKVYAFHRDFRVQPNKEVGFDRGVGQEEEVVATLDNCDGRSGYAQKVRVCNGAQTPKATQPELDLWIPLLFWFNKDPRLSVPSVAIPYGQRFIDFDLASAAEMLQHVGLTRALDNPGANPVTSAPTVDVCELYVNNIFVNPEVHTIIIKRIGFNLIRVHLEYQEDLAVNNNRVLLSKLKWPIETLYVGMIPKDNLSTTNVRSMDSWYKYTTQTAQVAKLGTMDANAWNFGAAALANDPGQADDYTASWQKVDGRGDVLDFATVLGVAGTTVLSVDQINQVLRSAGVKELDSAATFVDPLNPTNAEVLAALPSPCAEANWLQEAPLLDTLKVEAHGIDLYKTIPAEFFNNYIPYHFGGNNIRTPKDLGKYQINFCLYPGTYQPSGHINVSRAREFHIEYQSSVISSSNQAELHVIASALNFLLISDGSAIIRYST